MEISMKKFMATMAVLSLTASYSNCANAQALSKDDQIKQATSALPASMRAGALVISYDAKGAPVVLRSGSNNIFCTPNTTTDRFAVSCRGMALKPISDFQAKLKADGNDAKALTAATNAAYESGALKRAPTGTAIYNRAGATEAQARSIWVVMMPNAKGEDLGLPTSRVNASSPWVMGSGSPGAHIMIPQAASMDDLPPPPPKPM